MTETKEQICARLSEQFELDRRVAEAIGLHVEPDYEWSAVAHQFRPVARDGGGLLDGRRCWVFGPSTDIDDALWAARQVAVKVKVEIKQYPRGWRCFVSLKDSRNGRGFAEHGDVAIAICRAILDLKGTP